MNIGKWRGAVMLFGSMNKVKERDIGYKFWEFGVRNEII
jgi:hypothetical protein